MAVSLPTLPESLKNIQHYLKTATEHDKRDPVISYYCRLYAFQTALTIDKKSAEAKKFLGALIEYLETTKRSSPDVEAIQSELVGQAHVEHYTLQLFLYADNEDRAARFGKNVVKSFYSAGMLFDVLTTFGPLSEEFEQHRKYSKWKAAYIHRCLKSGETPVAGPLPEQGQDYDPSSQPGTSGGQPGYPTGQQPGYPTGQQPGFPLAPDVSQPPSNTGFPQVPFFPAAPPKGAASGRISPPAPQHPVPAPRQPPPSQPPIQPPASAQWKPPASASGVQLGPEQYQKAMKYCKYASSAMQYEDSPTAIDNLVKALNLLTQGHE